MVGSRPPAPRPVARGPAPSAPQTGGDPVEEEPEDELERRVAVEVATAVDDPLEGGQVLAAVARRLDGAGIAVTEAGLRPASLDEVFLALTGHRPQQPQEPPP